MNFSVLMSVYQNDDPIHYRLALKSVSTFQTLKPMQIVIVFDGPIGIEIEKITHEISESNPEIEFTIIREKVNRGLAYALNTGIAYCKFEYIARMDADDYSEHYRFQKQIGFLENNPEVDILGGYIAEFHNNPKEITTIRKVGCTHDAILKMSKHRNPFNHMSVIYKKSKIMAVGGYSTNVGKLEDYRLWVDLIASGCIMANLNMVLVRVRIGNGFIERRSNKEEIEDWDSIQSVMIQAGIINMFEAFINKINIRVFTYIPPSIKGAVYQKLLRSK